MTSTASAQPPSPRPAPFIRMLGWCNLAIMAAFLANVILTFWFDWPGAQLLMRGGDGPAALKLLQTAFYPVAAALAVIYVLRTSGRALRSDAALISDVNAFIVRAVFWAVFLIGLADITVSFLRVEGFLEQLVGNDLAVGLGRPSFRGVWVHVPAALIGFTIATFARTPGFYWLSLLVVLAELLIVFSRFIFSYEQAFMADLVRFWYAGLFLFASAYTLLEDGHVRVDVFYAGFTRRKQGRVNAVGSIVLGITFCWTILLVGMQSKTSIIISPIMVFEVTQAGFGMYVKYLMAGFLGVFATTMMIQFVSMFFDSIADTRSEPGGHEDHHASHIA